MKHLNRISDAQVCSVKTIQTIYNIENEFRIVFVCGKILNLMIFLP